MQSKTYDDLKIYMGATWMLDKNTKVGVRWNCRNCGANFWDEVEIHEIRYLHDRERWKAYVRACITCGRERSMRIDIIGQFNLFHPNERDGDE
jgi:hypothetical protein